MPFLSLHSKKLSGTALPILLALVWHIPAVQAATDSAATHEMQALQTLLQEQQSRLEQQEQQIREQQERFRALQQRVDALQRSPLISEMELERMRGTSPGDRHDNATGDTASKPNPAKATTKPAKQNKARPAQKSSNTNKAASPVSAKNSDLPETVARERKPEEPERPPEIAAFIEEGGVLLPRGTLVVTPEFGYLNSSATRVAIEGFSVIPALNIGLFEVSELDRNTLRTALNLRYGVTNRFEIEARIPYIYREDSTRNRPVGVGTSSDVLNRVDGFGLGDVEIGAHYQLTRGREGWPYFVGNLRFKSDTGTSPFEVSTDPTTGLQTELPTGSGFMALQPSVTAIYPTDPGVIYGNLGYLTNLSEDFGGTTGEISPGDSISASLGMSVALNDRSSFSIGYAHNTVFKTRRNDEIIPNSRNLQVGTIDFGFSHRVSRDTSVNLNVSAGITEDAPDASVALRVPMRFDFLN